MICTILTDGTELNGICRNEEEPPLVTVRSRLFTLMQTLVAQGYDGFWLNSEYTRRNPHMYTDICMDLNSTADAVAVWMHELAEYQLVTIDGNSVCVHDI